MSVITVDPVETIRAEAMRRIVTAGIFALDAIQRENMPSPTVVPYCRITVPQGAEYRFDSQKRQSKTAIVEFDLLTRALTGTQEAGQLAAKIEAEFGLFDRNTAKRKIAMPGWTGAYAEVYKFGRGSVAVEAEKNLFYTSVLLYVNLTLEEGAKYEI